MEDKGKFLILIYLSFPSSKLCYNCGYKNRDSKLRDREWTCPNCIFHHHRDVNASENIRKAGLKQLEKDNITIISANNFAVGVTVNAFGEDVRLMLGQQFSMNSLLFNEFYVIF
jgi:putative transposase